MAKAGVASVKAQAVRKYRIMCVLLAVTVCDWLDGKPAAKGEANDGKDQRAND
jgi:hypothetical protein